MKKLITRKIGSTFKTSMGTFKVEESETCEGCFLCKNTNDPLNKCGHNAFSKRLTGYCSALTRTDGRKVIFRKID